MERLDFRAGGAGERRESFLCMSGENGSLLYTSQHEYGASYGLVSSTQRGAFLSGLPRGGAPAAASNTGQEESLTGGARGAGMERCFGGSRKQTCAGSMKSSGRTERRSQKTIFVLVFPPGGQEETILPAVLR